MWQMEDGWMRRRYTLHRCSLLILAFLFTGTAVAGGWDEKVLIGLAHSAVRAEIEGKESPRISQKSPAHPVFVTIERKGVVMGCRGGLESRSSSLEEEIVLAARAAAAHDPRYRPLTPKDLPDCQVTVTIIDRLKPLSRIETLAPADGLVLRSGGKAGIVLPWEGKDPKVRLSWAYKKAGVAPGSACQLYLMKAERFRG
jgi:AMMECR1 domain-containing protein